MIKKNITNTEEFAMNSADDLLININYYRSQIYDYDNSIINKKVDFSKLDCSGRFDLTVDNTKFQCLFCNGENDRLYVTFNGAKLQQSFDSKSSRYNNPYFPRWSYYKIYNGCLLGFDDPMFQIYNNLNIGWFYGNKYHCYIEDCIDIVKKVCSIKKIDPANVIFFSSSGGGYAALLASIYMPNTLSISINPQIYIQNYASAENFKDCTGIDLNQFDQLYRNKIDILIRNSKSKHIIIVNIKSKNDFLRQLQPFCRAMDIPIRYGLSKKDNILIWTYEAKGAPSPHTSFETKYLYCAIDYIAEMFKLEKCFSIDKYQQIALLINEFWFDLYNHKNKLYVLENIEDNRSVLFFDDNKILTTKNKKIIKEFVIHPENNNYNFKKVCYIDKNSIYSIVLEDVKSSSGNISFTYGLYDFKNNKIIKYFIGQTSLNTIAFNFATNNSVDDIAFVVYSGLFGKTENNDLTINRIKIYSQSIF